MRSLVEALIGKKNINNVRFFKIDDFPNVLNRNDLDNLRQWTPNEFVDNIKQNPLYNDKKFYDNDLYGIYTTFSYAEKALGKSIEKTGIDLKKVKFINSNFVFYILTKEQMLSIWDIINQYHPVLDFLKINNIFSKYSVDERKKAIERIPMAYYLDVIAGKRIVTRSDLREQIM